MTTLVRTRRTRAATRGEIGGRDEVIESSMPPDDDPAAGLSPSSSSWLSEIPALLRQRGRARTTDLYSAAFSLMNARAALAMSW